MSIRKIESVRKRDGRIAAYDELKIAEAITRAARAAGQEAGTVGSDLAGVVTLYLERYREGDVPSSEQIQSLVEKILFDTGHAAVGHAFIAHRARKEQKGGAPPPAEDLFPSNLVLVDGATRGEVTPWGRDRIRAALVKEAGVDDTVATEIAGAVEQKIFQLESRRVSTTLIRELVNHELLARGHGSKLRRQIVVGLPKYDLGRLVGEEEAKVDPDGMCRVIGQTTLKQYALQELLTKDVADAHLEGRFHIHGLEEPLKLHALAPSVAEIRRAGAHVRSSAALSGPARDARTFTAQIGSVLAEARRFVSGPVTLDRLSEAYDQLLWGRDEDAAGLEIEHLAAALDGARTGVDARHRTALRIARLGGCTVRMPADAEAKDLCQAAAERGLVFAFERSAAPGPESWRGTAQAITVNLPQAFFRSEGGADFYGELEASLELAVKAHVQKRQLLRRFADRATGTFGPRAVGGAGVLAFDGLSYAVGLAGLNETVKLLVGEDLVGSDGAIRLALRIVSYVYFRLQEEARRHGLKLELEDVLPGDAIDRFVRIDAQMYPRARGLLSESVRYMPGFRVPGAATFETLAVEARFHTLVPSARAVVERAQAAPADLAILVRRIQSETMASNLAVE